MNFRKIWILFALLLIASLLFGGFYSALSATPDESEEMELIESGYYDSRPSRWELVMVYANGTIFICNFQSYKDLKENVDRIRKPNAKVSKLLFRRESSKRYYTLKLEK